MLLSTMLFIAMLFAVASRSTLFTDLFVLNARFEQVGGLRPGTAVLYRGINVGSVEEVRLPEQPQDPIVVSMLLRERSRSLVRTDTRAEIVTEGVVGDVILVLSAGSPDAPVVEDGAMIDGVEPLDFFAAAETVLETVTRFDSVAASVQGVLETVQAGEGTLGRMLHDPTAYDRMLGLANRAERTLEGLDREAAALGQLGAETAEQLQAVLAKVDRGDGTVARLLNEPDVADMILRAGHNLEQVSLRADTLMGEAELAAYWATVALYRAAENMEALQHHWLLRGFFKDRRDEQRTPFEIREEALTTSYELLDARARALRDWEQQLRALEARLLQAGALDAPLPPDSL